MHSIRSPPTPSPVRASADLCAHRQVIPPPNLVIPAKSGIQKGGRVGSNCHTINEQPYSNDNVIPAKAASGLKNPCP